MRRLLVLCYYYPPAPSAGSVRLAGLAKYLPRHGWEATVVTPARPGRGAASGRVVETADADLGASLKRALRLREDAALKDLAWSGGAPPASGLRLRSRLIDTLKSVVAVPDTNRGWIPIAAAAAGELLRHERFDALLSSSPPPSVHVAAGRLARECRLPWVADLRDLWADDRYSTAPSWRRWLDRRLEVRTFRAASALVTVSDPLAEELRRLHPHLGVHTIRNGFDPELVNPGEPLTPELSITHTGTYHQGRRDPSPLFAAVASLVNGGKLPRDRVRIRLFVRQERWLEALARRHGVADLVTLVPWASFTECLTAQRRSQVLLLLHWGGERERGVVTAKLFEYLAARRPILVLGGSEGALSEVLADTGAGVQLVDQPSLERQLLEWWHEIERTGAVRWRGDPVQLEEYSQLVMAERFASVLGGVAGRRPDLEGERD